MKNCSNCKEKQGEKNRVDSAVNDIMNGTLENRNLVADENVQTKTDKQRKLKQVNQTKKRINKIG